MNYEGTHISFIEGPPKPKTLTWSVRPKDGSAAIGHVAWHGPWRKYCFFTDGYTAGDAIFEWVCLREIADFCEQRTTEHRKAKEL